jgi:hypothetical protein
MRTRTSAAFGVGILLLLGSGIVVSACSGKTDSAGPESGSSGVPSDCPASVPALPTTPGTGTPCPKEGVLCEYGDAFDPLCNAIVRCDSGRWEVPWFGAQPSDCSFTPPAPKKPPPNPADCPATEKDVSVGASCNTSSTCNYEGGSCGCGVYCPQYPVGQLDCDADAGITANCCDRSKPVWSCAGPINYCPTPRPRVGSPCPDAGATCVAGPPTACNDTELQCLNGVWSIANTSCPVSTARAKKEIAYVTTDEAQKMSEDLMRVRLATYRYKAGDPSTHLGFIIEDMPEGSPAVLSSRDRVDLYGYVSMTVATLQRQQARIDALEKELAEMKTKQR